MDIFSCNTTGQRSRIDLIITGFNIESVLSEEAEGYFGPWGIFPLGSDYEGDNAEAIGSDWFDWEKLIGAVFTLKVIYGWNNLKFYIWRFQVCFGILWQVYSYNRGYLLLLLDLKLPQVILWDDLDYYKLVPCWINPL